MRRWAFLFIFCLTSTLLVLGYNDTVLGQDQDPPFLLADLRYEVYPEFSRIILASNEKIDYVTYELEDPHRIVIDLIGVSFCELQDHISLEQGLVKSVDVVPTPYAKTPKGLDEFFYAADYIVITPLAKIPYMISTAEGGRVVAIDIGRSQLAGDETPGPQQAATAVAAEMPAGGPAVIDFINYEVLDEISLLVISSSNRADFEAARNLYSPAEILLTPKGPVFTDLQETADFEEGLIKRIEILRGEAGERPLGLDKYAYPVAGILIEATDDLIFDFYTNDDGTISIFEVFTEELDNSIIEEAIVQDLKKELEQEGISLEEGSDDSAPPATEDMKRQLMKELEKEGLSIKAQKSKPASIIEPEQAAPAETEPAAEEEAAALEEEKAMPDEEEAMPDEEEDAQEERGQEPQKETPVSEAAAVAEPAIEGPAVIDFINYESLDDVSLLVISSSSRVDFKAVRNIYRPTEILLTPEEYLFCDLQETVDFEEGLIERLEILRGKAGERPLGLDEYSYSVAGILIEVTDDLIFDFYTNDDGTISIFEVFTEDLDSIAIEEAIKLDMRKELAKEGILTAVEIPEESELPATEGMKRELLKELKKESLFGKVPKAGPEPVSETETEPIAEFEEDVFEEDVFILEGEDIIFELKEQLKQEMLQVSEPEPEKPFTKEEIIRAIRQQLKEEGLLRKEKTAHDKFAEQEARKKKAAQMAALFGRETIADMIVKGKGMLTLQDAQSEAIKTSPLAKTVKEEASLATLKMKEAFRALWPGVKIQGTHTTGDVLTVDFIEETYGVQGEQAIYQGGRLFNTYKQTKVNLKLANIRYDKIKTDLDYKVAEAYFSAVTAVMNISLQEQLMKEAGKVLHIARIRYKSGLSTKLEILNVESRYTQIKFQLATAERDLALARFKLRQAMNLDLADEAMDLSEIDTELQFKILDVNLDKCLGLAYKNQPDIAVNKLLVESGEYGEKIAKGKDNFKIDLTGFYGKSGSHYDTEPDNLQDAWNIGVKVSKPFWGNTASYAFTQDKTSVKVGETDRTAAKSHEGSFAILDGMAIAADVQEAKVNKQRAENDLIEARRQIALEVKEAYYTYQEAIIQVRNSLEKVKFQEESLKVARARAGLNEALQSQLLEAMIKLADERSVYIKALSDYNLSLAKLNKAVGIKDYFNIE